MLFYSFYSFYSVTCYSQNWVTSFKIKVKNHFYPRKIRNKCILTFFFCIFQSLFKIISGFLMVVTKKLQKDKILGALAPKITSFYTTDTYLN